MHSIPRVVVGAIVCEGIDNTGKPIDILSALDNTVDAIPGRITGNIPDHSHISVWRDAYRLFGAKPKKYQSSIENLVRRIMKGYRPSHINALVDTYNLISLKYLLPVGGEDLDQTAGDIQLRFAGPDEPAIRLLGEKDARSPAEGEVIYTDDHGAICRRWNWKEADRTKLMPETRRAILVIEAFPPAADLLDAAVAELRELVLATVGGRTATYRLDQDNPECPLVVPEKK